MYYLSRLSNEKQLILTNGALTPGANNIIDLGASDNEWKDAFFDGTVTSDAFAGPLTGNVTGNAATATILASTRTIGGVSFNGSANINLPGVNAAGNQNTSGTAALVTVANSAADTNFPVVFNTISRETIFLNPSCYGLLYNLRLKLELKYHSKLKIKTISDK